MLVRLFCYIILCYFTLFAKDDRATLNIFTTPGSANVFLDGNPEKEITGTPFENSSMLIGEHSVFIVPPSESFVPATYDFILHGGHTFEINHDFLRRNQAREAYTLSPSEYHIEANSGFSYFYSFDSNSIAKIPLDFRLGLPLGFGARLAFPIQTSDDPGIKNFLLGLQYNYFPLQIGFAVDWISPRGEGFSAIRAAILAEQNVFVLNLLENLVYEYSKQDKAEFYLRAGFPIKHIFMPYLSIRKKVHLPIRSLQYSYLLHIEPGALLQAGNRISLEASIPLALIGRNENKGFGFYFGIHADFSFGEETKKENRRTSSTIWDVHEVSNKEYRKFCEETGCEIPEKAQNRDYDDYPVLSVSLKDAIAYSKWANKRLPTVDEWKMLAASYYSFDSFCEVPQLKKVYDGAIVNGIRNFSGNTAIWLSPENLNANIALFAGSSYKDSSEACKSKATLTDIYSSNGSDFIGIRLVRDYNMGGQ